MSAVVSRAKVELHGVALEIESDRTDVANALAERLRALPRATANGPSLVFTFRSIDDPNEVLARPSGASRSVYDTPKGPVEYFPLSDALFIDYGGELRMLALPGRCSVEFALYPNAETLWVSTHLLFTLALIELVKRRGMYSVHAAALAKGSRSIVLAGPTGAGKSTITLALLERGFEFIGDDMTFVRIPPTGPRLVAFPDEIDISTESLSLFPESRERLSAVSRRGWRKMRLPVEAVALGGVASESAPGLLVFPTVGGSQPSHLTPISRAEAMLGLVPNVIMTEQSSSQAHLSALTALVNQSACFRLRAGNDVKFVAERLEALLAEPRKT